MNGIADWKRDMDFLISPAPMPADRVAKGVQPITWGGGFAYVIPKTAHHKQGAWKLIQYLSSRDVLLRLQQGKREQKEAEGRLYLPTGLGNRKVFEELIHTYIDGNPIFELYQFGHTDDMRVLLQFQQFVAINNALLVDLTGNVCAESWGPRVFSGPGGQPTFSYAASVVSARSIIVLPSSQLVGSTREPRIFLRYTLWRGWCR